MFLERYIAVEEGPDAMVESCLVGQAPLLLGVAQQLLNGLQDWRGASTWNLPRNVSVVVLWVMENGQDDGGLVCLPHQAEL